MVETRDLKWKDPAVELPYGCFPYLDTDASVEVIVIIELKTLRYVTMARYHKSRGWIMAYLPTAFKQLYPASRVLQWAYLPSPVQEWKYKKKLRR